MLDSFLAKDPKKEQLGCDNMSCVLIEFNKLMLWSDFNIVYEATYTKVSTSFYTTKLLFTH